MLRADQNKTKSDSEGVRMKSLNFFLSVSLILLFSINAKAQFYANAFASAGMNMWGTGMWGGQQACPYPMRGGIGGTVEGLEGQVEKLRWDIDDIDEEMGELEGLNHYRLDQDRIGFIDGVAPVLAKVIQNRECPNPNDWNEVATDDNGESSSQCEKSGGEVVGNKCAPAGEQAVYGYCTKGQNPSQICEGPNLYLQNHTDGYRSVSLNSQKSSCKAWVGLYTSLNARRAKLVKDLEKAEKKLLDAEERRRKAEDRAFARGETLAPEGAYCVGCIVGNPVPEISGADKAIAIGTDIVSALIWRWGAGYVSRNNAALGYETPLLALGMPYPMSTASLYNAAYGGGGGFGCSPMIGMGNGYGINGMFGSPYGGFSPYGNTGGVFGYPGGGGYPGFPGPGFGGGIYNPGIGPWGMAGPWGGAGMFPGGFGINAGLGIGMGGNMGIGPWGMGGMGGAFPGAYPGPYGFGYGMGGGPFGGGITGFPGGMGGGYGGPFGNPYGGGGFMNPPFGGMGGMGGMYPGMGGMYPGMSIYNPYGTIGGMGMGGMYPGFGIGGGIGIGGAIGIGSPWGMMPGMGGGFGMGGGMYNPYNPMSYMYGMQQLNALNYETQTFLWTQEQRRQAIIYFMMSGGVAGGIGGGGFVNPPFGGQAPSDGTTPPR